MALLATSEGEGEKRPSALRKAMSQMNYVHLPDLQVTEYFIDHIKQTTWHYTGISAFIMALFHNIILIFLHICYILVSYDR